MAAENPEPSRVVITISWAAIFKILLGCLLSYWVVLLRPLGVLLFLSLLIAITLWPVFDWARRHSWPKWAGVLLCALILFGLVGLAVGIMIPTFVTQTGELIAKLPTFKEEVLKRLPETAAIRPAVENLLSSPSFTDPTPLLRSVVEWGRVVLDDLTRFFIILVVAVYFIVDGERVYEWLLAYLPEKHRRKWAEASPEIASVISHYMAGQFITSALAGLFAFVVLKLLHVPNALLFGVLAAVFDVLPLIGFFLFIIPAVAAALTVSPVAAALVGGFYTFYHLLENYFIVPKVYGNRLRLSTLTVLISCLAGGLLAGVAGIVMILPIVASYPIVERVWLRPYLVRGTVEKHEQIDEKALSETRPDSPGKETSSERRFSG